MPLQPEMKLISVDDHLIEHPNVWQDRLPEAYKEAGPRIVETETGQQLWQYEDRRSSNIGLNAVAGEEPSQFGMDPIRYDQMIPGCYEPAERLKDMDINGVHSRSASPPSPGAGTNATGHDKKLALLCSQAYNDFILDEWSRTSPVRLPPLVILPFWDVAASVAEVHRTAAKGAKAITSLRTRSRSGTRRSTRITGSRYGTRSRKPTCRSACTSEPRATFLTPRRTPPPPCSSA